ncbi:MAG: fucose isomerase [Oscillospiraceae bacterium]|nr:fucose isomerase [Oscillospiraceae bacterium]
MYKDKIRIGLMPTRRPVFRIETAREEYDIIMPIIRAQMPDYVEFVDIDDVCLQGMAALKEDIPKIVDKFTAAKVDALFFPFCDFGCEEVCVGVAKQFKLPVLIWGTRDKVSTYEKREKETQCGIFAATKVLRNYGVTYSYIWNCEADHPDFVNGFKKFVQVSFVLKALRNLNVAEIGDRPDAFYSVFHNQLALIQNFNITVKPIALAAIGVRTRQILEENSSELTDYIADFRNRIDCSDTSDEYVTKVCAGTIAIEQLMKEHNCKCAAFDCGGVRNAIDLPGSSCAIQGELADRGFPTACETDVWGAISQLICTAATLGEESEFLADWTYRHPTNDNAELIWHGGSFPVSLATDARKPQIKSFDRRGMTLYEAWWEMKQGSITMCRMDELNGEYYMFIGEGEATEGPVTTGTWVWLEVDDWKKWEERLMYGPFIHHVAGVYGQVKDVITEVARYLGVNVITPDSPCPKSLY